MGPESGEGQSRRGELKGKSSLLKEKKMSFCCFFVCLKDFLFCHIRFLPLPFVCLLFRASFSSGKSCESPEEARKAEAEIRTHLAFQETFVRFLSDCHLLVIEYKIPESMNRPWKKWPELNLDFL